MGITDVDDKIINRAKEKKRNPLDIAKEYERDFISDMDSLRVQILTVITM
jgi:cysteinyl-tRNA synthetase